MNRISRFHLLFFTPQHRFHSLYPNSLDTFNKKLNSWKAFTPSFKHRPNTPSLIKQRQNRQRRHPRNDIRRECCERGLGRARRRHEGGPRLAVGEASKLHRISNNAFKVGRSGGWTYPPYIMPHELIPSQQTETVAEHLVPVVLSRLVEVEVVIFLVMVTILVVTGFLVVVGVGFLVVTFVVAFLVDVGVGFLVVTLVMTFLVLVGTGGFLVVVDGHGGGMGLAETAQTS